MKLIIIKIKLFTYLVLLLSFSAQTRAFELLSEGAMGTVSASSGLYVDEKAIASDRVRVLNSYHLKRQCRLKRQTLKILLLS